MWSIKALATAGLDSERTLRSNIVVLLSQGGKKDSHRFVHTRRTHDGRINGSRNAGDCWLGL